MNTGKMIFDIAAIVVVYSVVKSILNRQTTDTSKFFSNLKDSDKRNVAKKVYSSNAHMFAKSMRECADIGQVLAYLNTTGFDVSTTLSTPHGVGYVVRGFDDGARIILVNLGSNFTVEVRSQYE